MNLTLGIRTKDLHVCSRRPVVVSIECPNPKPLPPLAPKLKFPELPLRPLPQMYSSPEVLVPLWAPLRSRSGAKFRDILYVHLLKLFMHYACITVCVTTGTNYLQNTQCWYNKYKV